MARPPMRTITVPEWWADEASPAPLLIELTAKRWKALMLVSAVLMLIGLAVLSWQMWVEVYRPILEAGFGAAQPAPFERFKDAMSGPEAAIGWLFLVIAIVLGLYARFMAWWRHG